MMPDPSDPNTSPPAEEEPRKGIRARGAEIAARFADLIVWIVATIAAALLFSWLLTLFPHPEGITWTALLPGGALLAIGFQLLRILTGLSFVGRLDRVDDLYGALGTAAVLMVWLFLVGRLVVAAMTLNAARHRAEADDRRTDDTETN